MAGAQTFGTAEAARRLGVSKQTLLRWFAENRVTDVGRDHRGWRRFDEGEVGRIRAVVQGK